MMKNYDIISMVAQHLDASILEEIIKEPGPSNDDIWLSSSEFLSIPILGKDFMIDILVILLSTFGPLLSLAIMDIKEKRVKLGNNLFSAILQ